MDPLISEDDRSVSSRPAGQPRRRSNADRLSDSSTVPHVPPTTGHLPSSPHICPRRIWLGFAVTSTVQGYGLALLPVGERGITASVCNSVCVSVSVREHISETTRPIIATFVHYTYGCGSVFYWRRRDILSTSGFVDGVDQGYAMQ